MSLNHILVIDNEPRWAEFCRNECGLEVATGIDGIQDWHRVIIISNLMFDYIPELATAYSVIVATGQPTRQESIKAFRLRAVDYIVKNFRKDILLKKLSKFID